MGLNAHASIFSFRLIWDSVSGEQFNMVLHAPDDIPEGGAATVEGNVDKTIYSIARALLLIEVRDGQR